MFATRIDTNRLPPDFRRGTVHRYCVLMTDGVTRTVFQCCVVVCGWAWPGVVDDVVRLIYPPVVFIEPFGVLLQQTGVRRNVNFRVALAKIRQDS